MTLPKAGGLAVAVGAYAAQYYRGRPYTKTVPFQVIINDDQFTPIWVPENAYFEIAILYIHSDTAGIDLNICDTNASQVFAFVIPSDAEYTPLDFGLAGYRSISMVNPILGIVDPTAAGATFKGWIGGWEVTRDGQYR